MLDIKSYQTRLARYDAPALSRGIVELLITIAPLALSWWVAWVAYEAGYVWLALLLALANAGFLVRVFMIQHDCGHGSFFPDRAVNDTIGRLLGVLTWTPYDYWRHAHAMHHASSGNLDRRGIGDLDTLTVREYAGLSRLGRFRYRLYRHPLVLFGIGPAYLFVIQHRFPSGFMKAGWKPWLSTMLTNVGIALFIGTLAWFVGVKALLLIHAPTVLLAASIGVWLFYVQHQFEHTTWERGAAWQRHEAALHGSSHYALPGPLRWFTANIGVHHVHHLSSRIPFYRLPQVLRDWPELQSVNRLTLMDSFRTAKLALWDEGQQRLVSFQEATQR